jgi:hypothetical protein
MGLLRRPTPGEIVEGGRFSRPCGPGAHSRASQKTNLQLCRHSDSSTSVSSHVPKRRPVSIVAVVSAGVSAAVASATRCVPSAMHHWPAVPSKVASSRGPAVTSHVVIRLVGLDPLEAELAHPLITGRLCQVELRDLRRVGTPAGVGPARVAGRCRPRLPAGSASIQPAYRRTPGRPSNLCEATRRSVPRQPTATSEAPMRCVVVLLFVLATPDSALAAPRGPPPRLGPGALRHRCPRLRVPGRDCRAQPPYNPAET